MIRLVLVDNHAEVRRALRMWLELDADVVVVGEAQDGLEALDVVAGLRPDVVLMETAMPRMDGFTAASRLRAIAPQSAIVFLSMHDDAAMRQQAHAVGVAAFLDKHLATSDVLRTTIRAAATG